MWAENLTVATLEAFVDAAGSYPVVNLEKGLMQSGCTLALVYSERRDRRRAKQPHSSLSRSTSIDYLEALQNVLPQQDVWTVPQLLEKLNLPRTTSENVAMGKALARLGWTVRRTTSIAVYAKDKAHTFKNVLPSDYENTLRALAAERNEWSMPELLTRLGMKLNRSSTTVIGSWFLAEGWTRRRVSRAKTTVYTRPSTQA